MTNQRFTSISPATAARVALGYHNETMSLSEAYRNAGFAGNLTGHGLRHWNPGCHDAEMLTLQWFGFGPHTAYMIATGVAI